MKRTLTVLFAIFWIAIALHTQKRETAKLSVEETISWMENFSRSHGFMLTRGELVRVNAINGVKACTISVEVHFSKSPRKPVWVAVALLRESISPGA